MKCKDIELASAGLKRTLSIYIRSFWALAAALLCAISPGRAEYSFTDPAPASSQSSWATEINESGRVLGTAYTSENPNYRSFIWENDRSFFLPVSVPAGILSITDDGVVTGDYAPVPYSSEKFSFLWKDGLFTPLGPDGTPGCLVQASANGLYAGIYPHGVNRRTHLFVRSADTFIDLSPLADNAQLLLVTDSGYVVGHFLSGENHRVFTWRNGQYTNLGPPDAKSTMSFPGQVNHASGMVFGSFRTDFGVHAFVWREGVFTDLAPTSRDAEVRAVNSSGEVVGKYLLANGSTHAFYWKEGVFRDLSGDLPDPSADSRAEWIFDSGWVIGYQSKGAADLAFAWKNNVATILAPAGSKSSYATEFLADDTVIGNFTSADGIIHAYVWKDGVFTDLTPPGLSDVKAITVINHDLPGRFICDVEDTAGKHHAFVWQDGVASHVDFPPTATSIRIETATDSGYLAGSYQRNSVEGHPFIWFEGTTTDLAQPGESQGTITSINESGDATVVWMKPSPSSAGILDSFSFLWKDGAVIEFAPPSKYSRGVLADHISESGIVTGGYTYVPDDSYIPHDDLGSNESFVWMDGVYLNAIIPGAISVTLGEADGEGRLLGKYTKYDRLGTRSHAFVLQEGEVAYLEPFLPPGTYSSKGVAINAAGQIAGEYEDANFARRAFLLTPGPTSFPPSPTVPTETIDAPLVQVSSRPPKKTTQTTVSVRGNAVGTVSFRVNKGPWQSVKGTANWKISARLKYGRNEITIRSINARGETHLVKLIVVRK